VFHLDGGLMLSIYPRSELARDAAVSPANARPGEFTIGHVVDSRAEVDEVISLAEAAGAGITDAPHDRPWGIYSGYFQDPTSTSGRASGIPRSTWDQVERVDRCGLVTWIALIRRPASRGERSISNAECRVVASEKRPVAGDATGSESGVTYRTRVTAAFPEEPAHLRQPTARGRRTCRSDARPAARRVSFWRKVLSSPPERVPSNMLGTGSSDDHVWC
jgi:hypothetical protein